MSAVDDLLMNNEEFAWKFDGRGLPRSPSRGIAVVACMDARVDVYRLLGLALGDAHVIRNAGGVVTEDVVRSLLVSQRLLGTREIALVHHTDCGMQGVREEDVTAQVQAETARPLPFSLEAFDDLVTSVRESIARLRANPFLPHTDRIRGFIYDVETGRLAEVRP